MATARGLLRMLAAMRAPCSAKAKGRCRMLRLEVVAICDRFDAVTICDRISLSRVCHRSATGHLLQLFGVTSSLHGDLGSGAIDFTEVVRREFECNCSDVLVQAMQLRGAWNWNDPRLLRQQPSQGDLSGCR